MNKKRTRKQLYEGKAKILYEGTSADTIIQHFKDDATAFNGVKKDIISGKGVLNNRISEYIMNALNLAGISTHYIKTLNMREQLVKKVEIIPLEVIVRNFAAGSFSKRYGVEEGEKLPTTYMEFCLKDDKLGDPVVSEDYILHFGVCNPLELEEIKHLAFRINDILFGIFYAAGIKLVDFKIEFGRSVSNGFHEIILADEVSPDSCRLWDLKTNAKLDKDIFRRDLGSVIEGYKEVASRLGIFIDNLKG